MRMPSIITTSTYQTTARQINYLEESYRERYGADSQKYEDLASAIFNTIPESNLKITDEGIKIIKPASLKGEVDIADMFQIQEDAPTYGQESRETGKTAEEIRDEYEFTENRSSWLEKLYQMEGEGNKDATATLGKMRTPGSKTYSQLAGIMRESYVFTGKI